MTDFSPFDSYAALAINRARLEHLSKIGIAYMLRGKQVLEVGSGIGHFTRALLDSPFLCSWVVSTEGKEANVEEHKRRYPSHMVRLADLNEPYSHYDIGSFPVVFSYGTLYHCGKPDIAISTMSVACQNILLLESIVSPKDGTGMNLIQESADIDQSLDGWGCRPSRDWVVRELYKYFPYVYLPKTQPDHPDFPSRWPPLHGTPRAIFVAFRRPCFLSTLTYIPHDFSFLPMEYSSDS